MILERLGEEPTVTRRRSAHRNLAQVRLCGAAVRSKGASKQKIRGSTDVIPTRACYLNDVRSA